MHFPLAADTKGVSLERLSADAPSQNYFNWHSAAADAGYATPGSANSQQLREVDLGSNWTLSPEVFSPDNDGSDDVAVIRYDLPGPGYVADIIIYNAAGRVVKTLITKSLLTSSGIITWDGTDEQHQRAPVGVYIVYASIFDLQGKVRTWKRPLVLAK